MSRSDPSPTLEALQGFYSDLKDRLGLLIEGLEKKLGDGAVADIDVPASDGYEQDQLTGERLQIFIREIQNQCDYYDELNYLIRLEECLEDEIRIRRAGLANI
jgi:hypothetical protein